MALRGGVGGARGPRGAIAAEHAHAGLLQLAVTVVIPAYRAATTIVRAVQSVLRQTVPAREIVIVDDGSPDDVSAALEPIRDHVTLLHKPNGGAASARNVGLDYASGDVIAFLDADDYWEPHKLARQLAVLARHPEVGIIGAHLYLEPPGDPRAPDPAMPPGLLDRVLRVGGADAFAAARAMWTGTVLVRRDVLAAARFDEGLTTAEDRDLWMRVLLSTCGYLVGEPLATQVLVPGSLSRSNVERDCRNMLTVIDRYRDVLGPEAYARCVTDVHRRWSGRMLARGDGRAALRPAVTRLVRAPSAQAAWVVAKSAWTAARRWLSRPHPS